MIIDGRSYSDAWAEFHADEIEDRFDEPELEDELDEMSDDAQEVTFDGEDQR